MGFENALKKVLSVEGGFVDIPEDKGGPTNYGITMQTFEVHMGKYVTKEDLKNIPMNIVENIYRNLYWDRMRLDFVEYEPLAEAMFDQGVNRGVGQVSREIQRLVNVKDDGVVGSITLGAINSMVGRNLLISFIKKAQLYYARIVQNEPNQGIFLVGWLKRTHKLFPEDL
ncbi:MAG: hypothetical protein KDD13_00370 [Mangrovimonas sp.]|nr:hypothetical protein [Mangrovimonas sp.]